VVDLNKMSFSASLNCDRSKSIWSSPKGDHGIYNEAVAELSDQFMRERNITPETMTPDQARDLLKAVRESDDPRIRSYNRVIRMLRRFFRSGRE
jgi:hypothetical protein